MTPEEPRRPDPDALLAATRAGQGRLKVFLGMSPGVGKTYEMLRAARRRKAEGGDVVVGVVETHGRKETQSLLRGLDVMPRKPIEYRGRALMEFDLDAALARKPELLLVDEYAHSNAPGSRHPKRWQDVEELLAAGIDVWTTLNVQHLESLLEVVWKITGVRQRETVPDSALSRADEIELIDITPSELRERMAEGKVYMKDTARVAADRFFKVENLTALRELALRRAAQTVDDQLIGAMKRAGVEGPWAAGERILVLVGPDPMASALVRAGRRLSDMMMDAPWTVANVERPNATAPSAGDAQRLRDAMKLATQLGGQTVTLTGDDLVASVIDFARRNNVTQIVVGRRERRGLRLRRDLIGALLQEAGGAALHVITESAETPAPELRTRPSLRDLPWRGHLGAFGTVAVAASVAWLIDQYVESANLAMVFMLSVLVSGIAFGLWPAVLAAGASAVAYNFFFLEPKLTMRIGHPADVLTFAVFFAVALTTGWLTGRVRDQARSTSRRASAIAAVLAATRRLSGSTGAEEAARALAEQLAAATGARAIVLGPYDGDLKIMAATPALTTLPPGDMAAARWCWEKGEATGHGTGTMPMAAWTFRPLQGVKTRSGVVGVEPSAIATEEGERFVSALLDQGAVALERAEFATVAAGAEALRRTDQLRSALLNSVSHDLRTPLSTVLGAATTVIDYGDSISKEVRDDLMISIREEAERLNRYVGNLLDVTRLEGGGLNIRNDWVDVRDVLVAAAERVSRRLGKRHIQRDFPNELALVRLDPNLLEQAVVNILENAIAYSPDDTAIELAAYEDRNNIVISIEDEGKGIPTAELARVFEKFHRMQEPSDRNERGKGVGLGLSISKGFIEAMGGRIAAASPIHGDRGTRVLISLPKAPRAPESPA
ncbi:sensor histidine kinase KdpD [Phenylobacterium sp.]|uniref:sensor histidine kinase n=1 Tax=Phenylobacterium sp. TaxID=1871053 RepID=UPI0025DDACB7|nr:sensor histidine kinase KdpD [Phenylobacterium sp.]